MLLLQRELNFWAHFVPYFHDKKNGLRKRLLSFILPFSMKLQYMNQSGVIQVHAQKLIANNVSIRKHEKQKIVERFQLVQENFERI